MDWIIKESLWAGAKVGNRGMESENNEEFKMHNVTVLFTGGERVIYHWVTLKT